MEESVRKKGGGQKRDVSLPFSLPFPLFFFLKENNGYFLRPARAFSSTEKVCKEEKKAISSFHKSSIFRCHESEKKVCFCSWGERKEGKEKGEGEKTHNAQSRFSSSSADCPTAIRRRTNFGTSLLPLFQRRKSLPTPKPPHLCFPPLFRLPSLLVGKKIPSKGNRARERGRGRESLLGPSFFFPLPFPGEVPL